MTEFELIDGLYVAVTPAGAFHAISGIDNNALKHTLIRLLRYPDTPLFDLESLRRITAIDDEQVALDQIYRLQEMKLIQGQDKPGSAPHDSLETILPRLLAGLSRQGRVMLADEQGFYLGAHGFNHETLEEIASLSADLGSLHARHANLLEGNLGLHTSSWGLINAGGVSEIGFWPLFISKHRFVLVIGGIPHLDQEATRDLIWALFIRYGD
jgi:hypothetical protein